MSSEQRRQQFQTLLERFNHLPLKIKSQKKAMELMQQFIVCYLGMCFIEGYRIFQKIGNNLFILSLMQYQHTSDYIQSDCRRLHGMFRIVYVDFKEDLNQNSELRSKIFRQIIEATEFLKKDSPSAVNACMQIHFIFAYNHKFAIVDEKILKKGEGINVKDFYQRGKLAQKVKYAMRHVDQRSEGTKLHEFLQLFLKGAGVFRNPQHLQRQTIQGCKFNYNLDTLINTLCLVIGKQVLENGYLTISSEKWMRKLTVRKFKRFDLLMRNQDKVCIIDWKFSKTQANEKIITKAFSMKNRQYFQLARKQYNANVQLKFYCFHQRQEGVFHRFSCATYDYQQEEVELNDDSSLEQAEISEQSIQIQQIDIPQMQNKKKKPNKKNQNQNNNNQSKQWVFEVNEPQNFFIPKKTIDIRERINMAPPKEKISQKQKPEKVMSYKPARLIVTSKPDILGFDSHSMNNKKQDFVGEKPKIQKIVYNPYSSKVYKTFAEQIPRDLILKKTDQNNPHTILSDPKQRIYQFESGNENEVEIIDEQFFQQSSRRSKQKEIHQLKDRQINEQSLIGLDEENSKNIQIIEID